MGLGNFPQLIRFAPRKADSLKVCFADDFNNGLDPQSPNPKLIGS